MKDNPDNKMTQSVISDRGRLILLIALLFNSFAFSCNTPKSIIENVKNNYDFAKADSVFILDSELEEISGLCYDGTRKVIYTHNDEDGKIFTIDPGSGEIVSEIKFAKKNDYEGIEYIDDKILITTSAGRLYTYDLNTKETESTNTRFRSRNDVEGLHYHKNEEKLLFACKEEKFTLSDADKGIYTYDAETKEVTAFLEIDYSEIESFVKTKFTDAIQVNKITKRARRFAPSGISIHPVSDDIYVLSARLSTLLIYNESKELKEVVLLDESILPQPEGICFDGVGNLFISSEADGGRARLVKYSAPSSK